jgi:PadR family transcriptional regulator PadR
VFDLRYIYIFYFLYIINIRNLNIIKIGEELKMFFGKRFSGYHRGTISGLEILVLSIIKNAEEKISGYEIIHEINEKFGKMWRASAGTIYPLLHRLNQRNLVESEEIIDENNRQKRIYKITQEGVKELKKVLENNLPLSIETLGDYLKTIMGASLPSQKTFDKVMCCFPFPFPDNHHIDVDEEDFSLENIKRLERIIDRLTIVKGRLSNRLGELDQKISNYETLLKNLMQKREKSMKEIPIVDDDEFEEDF